MLRIRIILDLLVRAQGVFEVVGRQVYEGFGRREWIRTTDLLVPEPDASTSAKLLKM